MHCLHQSDIATRQLLLGHSTLLSLTRWGKLRPLTSHCKSALLRAPSLLNLCVWKGNVIKIQSRADLQAEFTSILEINRYKSIYLNVFGLITIVNPVVITINSNIQGNKPDLTGSGMSKVIMYISIISFKLNQPKV